MFAVKVGDEVGAIWSGSASYANATIHKVTKINGHGHIFLDNGDVYDKHGDKRMADKKAYNTGRIVEATVVYANKAANQENRRQRDIMAAVTAKLNGMSNGFGRVFVNAGDKEALIALINSL